MPLAASMCAMLAESERLPITNCDGGRATSAALKGSQALRSSTRALQCMPDSCWKTAAPEMGCASGRPAVSRFLESCTYSC